MKGEGVMSLKIDYISDLHLDFYIRIKGKWQPKMVAFLTSLLPKEKGDVLIIAGDLSHYNVQSFFLLKFFSDIYKQLFFVLGNHDYYLVAENQEKKYHRKSIEREIELTQMISVLPNVKLLSLFEAFVYKGVTFAGSTSWYGLETIEEQQFFKSVSNDSVLIKGIDISLTHKKEMEAYEQLQQVDVLITHVPPIILDCHTLDGSTSCYLNELSDIFAKICIFGHCHTQELFEKAGIIFCANALGYPDQKLPKAIQSIYHS